MAQTGLRYHQPPLIQVDDAHAPVLRRKRLGRIGQLAGALARGHQPCLTHTLGFEKVAHGLGTRLAELLVVVRTAFGVRVAFDGKFGGDQFRRLQGLRQVGQGLLALGANARGVEIKLDGKEYKLLNSDDILGVIE